MRRRTFIGAVCSGAISFVLLRCNGPYRPNGKHGFLEADDYLFLTEVVDTIIPLEPRAGQFRDELVSFIVKMVNDCHAESERIRFTNGLQAFRKRGFVGFASTERERLFSEAESGKEGDDDDIPFFCRITKRHAIKGFLNSRYVMRDLGRYKLIPGRYDGYFPG